MEISCYRTHVFDCDGVLLDSNLAKSQAFLETTARYGPEIAARMVAFHQQAGGISRRDRFGFLFDQILRRPPERGEMDRLLADCGRRVVERVRQCPVMPGVVEYLDRIDDGPRPPRKLVVSGVEAGELMDLLAHHRLLIHFDGVWGGPDIKDAILQGLVEVGDIQLPAVYYGDTRHDYEAALAAGLDFVFVSGASEWPDWREFFARLPVTTIEDFRERAPCSQD